MKCIACLLGAC